MSFSICTNGVLQCEKIENCQGTTCPKNQVHMDSAPPCNSCENYDKCDETEPILDTCACPDGTVAKQDV